MADATTLARARELGMQVARDFPASRRIGRSGRHTMRVPAAAFYSAIEANGGVNRDGQTVWDDPEFSRDMQRLYPECAVADAAPRRVFAMAQGGGGRGRRNRFGRVTWRRVYP